MAIISVDFDGTCVSNMYPEIGEDIGAQEVLKKLVDAGNKLILLTMRCEENNTLQPAIKWFEDNDIPLWGINKNPTQFRWSRSRKVFADTYIDDQYLGCPLKFDENTGKDCVDWKKVELILKLKGLL